MENVFVTVKLLAHHDLDEPKADVCVIISAKEDKKHLIHNQSRVRSDQVNQVTS